MLKNLVILTYFTQISIAQVVDTTDEKQCYYCGLVDNCEMPYNVEDENVKKISCEKSCLKFDGNAKDGKRVVLRTCGYFTTDECVEGAFYEDKDTIGTICHCLDNDCNSAENFGKISVFLMTLTSIITMYFSS